jgi:catechol 2,3-dioxygenase-like lactoylglutathione lyase family enzyme
MLSTKDLHATIQFYTTHLGFHCDSLSEADGWASLSRDSIELMVSAPNRHTPFDKPIFTGSFYFNVDDAAALWPTLKVVAKVCYPLEDFHYGIREFAIYDNNGYLLQFGSPIG